ncbi:MAG: 2-C-methyl-D-erythritol 2,4-cyclodiphosphate synthase [Streptococcaceae bacterium]|jgi:2-C-methyl-D-erythritol 2,4-cyclodiphosphate synthase|nr:2-C-methyl-D-erythritol 2,4-cyclodiphosphate synthase [Streptococcaceae bacterium]
MNFRVGHGFDVHRLVVARPLILGGVKLNFKKGLLGHSDADVLLHAVSDALLGAASLGDIGQTFPPDDPKIKEISSVEILRNSFLHVHDLGYNISNIDATVLAEQPKMKPYLKEMIKNIATVCEIKESQVNLKATTTERLGFIGRKEGIAAEAVVLIFIKN